MKLTRVMKSSKTTKVFIKGLLFTLPIALTIGIVVWIVRATETLLSSPLKLLMPSALHFPGMGIVLAIVVIYLIGLAVHGRFVRVIFDWLKSLMQRAPLISVIYNSINELIEFTSGERDQDMERVVLVELAPQVKLIGFVTQTDTDIVEDSKESIRAVYLPMSYQMGGYLLYLPESKLTTLQISKKEAMQRVLTADISGSSSKRGNLFSD